MYRVFLAARAFTSSNKHSSEFVRKFKLGDYYGVLGIENPTINDEEVKFKYYGIMKKYHTDYAQDLPKQMQFQYDEITKYVNRAFEAIMYERNKNQIKNQPQFLQKENQISMKIFGKPIDEMKYKMYQDQYAEKRAKFFQEIRRVRGGYEQIKKQKQARSWEDNQKTTPPYRAPNAEQQNSYFPYIIGSVFAIIGTSILYAIYQQSKMKVAGTSKIYQQPRKLQKHEIKKLVQNTFQKVIDRDNKVIQTFANQRPKNILKYPNTHDLHLLQQLVEFSIGPDIHLYEVHPDMFLQQEKFRTVDKKENQQSPFSFSTQKLDKIKPNTVLTLSLQAERCLQNVHVKVQDIIDEVQKTGTYKPPLVLFKFHGYIMVEIRPKPFSLKNYSNTQYISLFDLYFDYYSPILFKRSQYCEYLVGHGCDDQDSYFGYVNLNRRPIKQILLNEKAKNFIISKSGHKVVNVTNQAQKPSGDRSVWQNYYRIFYDRLSSDKRAKDKSRSTVLSIQHS